MHYSQYSVVSSSTSPFSTMFYGSTARKIPLCVFCGLERTTTVAALSIEFQCVLAEECVYQKAIDFLPTAKAAVEEIAVKAANSVVGLSGRL